MTRPITKHQKSKRVEIQLRRLKALDLKVRGFSDRSIGRELNVSASTAHNDVNKILGQLAERHVGEAANLRSLLNLRYEALFHKYFDQALAGEGHAVKVVITLLDRITKINGLVPDKSLVTVDQRCLNVEQPITFRINSAANIHNDSDID